MRTPIIIALLIFGMNITAQKHEWIELRYSVSASKHRILVVGDFKPYGLETDNGEKVNNIPVAIGVMEGRGFEYVEIYPIAVDPGLGVTIYYTCVLMRKLPTPQTGFTGSEPNNLGQLSAKNSTQSLPITPNPHEQ